MKKSFKNPHISILIFDEGDIITTSNAAAKYETKVRDAVTSSVGVNITEVNYLDLTF